MPDFTHETASRFPGFAPGQNLSRLSRLLGITPDREKARGGTAPLLILQGVDDRICPPANSRAFQREFNDRARLVEVPDARHMLTREQPESLSHATAFMGAIDAGTN